MLSQKIVEIYDERIHLGWTEGQALYYISVLSDELVKSWKPIKMVWSHE